MKTSELLSRVTDSLASVTRYPKEVLAPHADLENDLGIDSVKLVEILVAFGRDFNIDLMNQERDPSIRTIQQLANWIGELQLKSPARADSDQAAPSRYMVPELSGKAATPVPPSSNAPAETNERPDVSSLGSIKQNTRGFSANANPPNGHSILDRNWNTRNTNGAIIKPSLAHLAPSAHEFRSTRQVTPNEEPPIAEQAKVLSGRVALVTGSGRGVGRTIARLLAMRGATVIVNSFHSRDAGDRTAAEINDQGGQAIHLWGSVANSGHVDNIFDEITERVGQLDILVCNASDGRIGSFANVTPEDWERAFRTNVVGHYQCAMRASRLMELQGGGSIVTMSSIAARRYVEGLGGQGVVKAAVESMTRHLACELAPLGIRVNCISGGPVYGQVMSMYSESRATMNYWETLVLDNELCSPMDLAYTVAFLVSDEARGVNGAIWNVDHGLSTRSHSRPLPKAQGRQASNSATS